MDAWGLLLEHSTLPATGFDAWEHLNAQEGGPGGVGGTYLVSTLDVDLVSDAVDVEMIDTIIDVELIE